MTQATEWRGPVGQVWADEWRRTDQAFAALDPHLIGAMLAAAPPQPFRALDVGCGAGATSLALATVRPDAALLGVDLSDALIAVARERAMALRAGPVAGGIDLARGGAFPTDPFAVGASPVFVADDALDRAERSGPFDLIVSRHGVMFFPDPVAAFAALHRSIAPARTGQAALVFTCFADPADNAFAAPLAQALDLPSPTADGTPGPFAFADPSRVARILSQAGWQALRHERVAFSYRIGSGPDALDDAIGFLARIGPVARAMREAPAGASERLRARLREYLAGFLIDDTVDLPAAAWLWSASA